MTSAPIGELKCNFPTFGNYGRNSNKPNYSPLKRPKML